METLGKVVSAGLDGQVRFVDGFAFESQMPVIRCMAIQPKDQLIALGGPDGAISVHDKDGRLQRHWEGHAEGTVYSLLWWNEVRALFREFPTFSVKKHNYCSI